MAPSKIRLRALPLLISLLVFVPAMTASAQENIQIERSDLVNGVSLVIPPGDLLPGNDVIHLTEQGDTPMALAEVRIDDTSIWLRESERPSTYPNTASWNYDVGEGMLNIDLKAVAGLIQSGGELRIVVIPLNAKARLDLALYQSNRFASAPEQSLRKTLEQGIAIR